jgi:lipoic acid synthetase
VESGAPQALQPEEPERVAEAARALGLKHVVLTSVTRDDLPDGGAAHFTAAIRAVRRLLPQSTVEVLVPDFGGSKKSVLAVLGERPEVFNHNIETVPRLYNGVRPQADYQRSVQVLRWAAERGGCLVKSGLMVGLGETAAEVEAVLKDLFACGCRAVTVGQYLAPSPRHYAVAEFVRPEDFDAYARLAHEIGFERVASGPFVRSSYGAAEMFKGIGV